jgi:hypothetical protein
METGAAIIGLIGSLGSAAAAVFVCYFLVTKFSDQTDKALAQFLQQLRGQHDELMALAKDKGQIIREDTAASQRLSLAIEQMTARLAQIEVKIAETKCRMDSHA